MPNIITSLKIQEKDKTRVNVFLDGEFAFGLSLNAALGLHKGQELSEVEIEQLKAADDRQRGYTKALNFLGFRARSQAEIEKYLQEKAIAPAVIAEVVQRLLAEKYLDDETFARQWVENRAHFRPRSARALRYELRQKGVDNTVVDDVISEVDDEAAAWAALEPKLERWRTLEQMEFYQKVTSFLARRGFNYAVTRRICKRAWATLGNSGDDEMTEMDD
ncbi:MAG: RecX family transcriptional regulator [Caldilineaceae bacterium]